MIQPNSRITTGLAADFALMLQPGHPMLAWLTSAAMFGYGMLSMQAAYAKAAVDWFDSGNKKFEEGDYQREL